MNITIILLICVLSNLCAVFLGYKLGSDRQIIEITKGDVVRTVPANPEVMKDEPAYWLTPEEETAINLAYESSKLKERDKYGI